MANNYSQTSFAVQATDEEKKVWEKIEELAAAIAEEDPDYHYSEADACGLEHAVHALYEDLVNAGGFGFKCEANGDDLWFYDDGTSVNCDLLADLLQIWLDEIDCDKPIVFSWANTCSKPALDEFDGGSVVVTRKGSHWFSGPYLADQCVCGMGLAPASSLLGDLMHEHGWQTLSVMALLEGFLDDNPEVKSRFHKFLLQKAKEGEEQ